MSERRKFNSKLFKVSKEGSFEREEYIDKTLMPRNKRTYERLVRSLWHQNDLLDLAIAKWLTLAALAMKGIYIDYDGGVITCPLCMLYNVCGMGKCYGCPVYDKHIYCNGTPYESWNNLECDNADKFHWAKAEVRFLRGLKTK